MAPHRETTLTGACAYSNSNVNQQISIKNNKPHHQQPPRLSMENLQRTLSDITSELCKDHQESMMIPAPQVPSNNITIDDKNNNQLQLPLISETEDAKCECCGMSEECSQEYMTRVRNTYSGKLICGLCAEAVREEMEKNGGKILEEALKEHMSACARFNRIGRAYPVLCQAQAMREIFKSRANSISPRPLNRSGGGGNGISITRSSSCIPNIILSKSDIYNKV